MCNAYNGPCVVSASICDSNTRVQQLMQCTPVDGGRTGQGIWDGTCGAPYTSRVDCPNGGPCSGGECLTRAVPPARSCSMVSDCPLPSSICVGSLTQMVFADPTCDEGQCHWKQIVNNCDSYMCDWCQNSYCEIVSGQCVPKGLGASSSPVAASAQPPNPTVQTCSKAGECTQPPTSCFYDFGDSVVSYVQPACRTGSCVWEIALSQCAASETCVGGACIAP
jgi:hypothetical protein